MQNRQTKGSGKLVLALLFVYIVLFEFILPVNKYLPKPSLLYESVSHIWQDYNLVYALSTTVSMVILSLVAGFFSAYINSANIFKMTEHRKGIFDVLKIFTYVPMIFVIAMFTFWFNEYFFAEFLFALLASIVFGYSILIKLTSSIKQEYVDVAQNLGCTQTDVYQKIYWKSLLPDFTKEYNQIHIKLWAVVLLVEFVLNMHGVGHVLRRILEYRDFTALINVALMVIILIWLGDYLIYYIRKKFISWDNS